MDDALQAIEIGLAGARRVCVTSSFQHECVVLVHLLIQVRPDIPVIFLDTWHHFLETYRYRDEVAAKWKLNLVNVAAVEPRVGLWESSTDACCKRHKVGPLFDALQPFDVWFTALRREQSPSRANLAVQAPFQLPGGKFIEKVSPLAAWATRDVEAYAAIHEIPLLPLYAQGYTSIGCAPCTAIPTDPTNARSGRWGGSKLECGIHIEETNT